MKIEIRPDRPWYHGSDTVFSDLRPDSTITQWRELAEAFSHQPSRLSYDDDGVISHNGKEKGYLYIIDEPVIVGTDIVQHPQTVMGSKRGMPDPASPEGPDDLRAVNGHKKTRCL